MVGSFNMSPVNFLGPALMTMSKESLLTELNNLAQYGGMTPAGLSVIQQARNYIINDGWIYGQFNLSSEDMDYLNENELFRRGVPTMFHTVRDECQQQLHSFYAVMSDGLNIQPHPVKPELFESLPVVQVITSKAGGYLRTTHMKMNNVPDWEVVVEEFFKQPRW